MSTEMDVFAAVATGHGIGAITTIELAGSQSQSVINSIFYPQTENSQLDSYSIHVGQIKDDEKIIDQVAIGCEKENHFSIHCHGNPLLVEMIMEILQKKGTKLVSYESLMEKKAKAENKTSIEAESIIILTKCKSLSGVKLIQHQISKGLLPTIMQWLSKDIDGIKKDAERIIVSSNHAKLLINGCKVAICGQPNSGKSTLFNQLCGRQKAIVTDIKGTTRDWISADISYDSVNFEVFDTAGIDNAIIESHIDKESQNKTIELAKQSDIILLILDGSIKENAFDIKLLKTLVSKTTVAVINKSDLPLNINQDILNVFANRVKISAQTGSGIDKLLKKLLQVTGLDSYEVTQTAAFTERQVKLFNRILGSDNPERIKTFVNELLYGKLFV